MTRLWKPSAKQGSICTLAHLRIQPLLPAQIMKLPLLLALLSLAATVRSQDAPQFAKYQVSGTGCHVDLPGNPGEFELSLSEDSSEIYIGEVSHKDYLFAVIAVKFK